MEPTPYALHLIEPIGYALSTLQNALNQRDSFDPATSERTFTLGVTDIGEIYFMPTLMAMLSSEAPNIKISTLRHNTGHLSDAQYREIFAHARGRYGSTLDYARQTLDGLRRHGIEDRALARLLRLADDLP